MKKVAIGILLLLCGIPAFAKDKVKYHPRSGVPGEYIVVLNEDIPTSEVARIAKELTDKHNVALDTVWEYSLRGFLAKGDQKNVEKLADDPRILFAEQNYETNAPEPSATQWTVFNGQSLWHLDRIDETSWANADGQYNMCSEARSVYAYVIDSGVQANHPQFETPSRVVRSLDFSDDRTNPALPFTTDVTNACTTGAQTTNGNRWHGTAVASLLAGTQVGAAKTQIVSLKVMRCSNGQIFVADLIDATNWIAGPDNPYRTLPGVINHSGFVGRWQDELPGDDRSAYAENVARTVATTTMPFFTSANNFSADSCQFSPGDLTRARTYANPYGTVFVVGGSSAGATAGDPNDYRFQEWDGGLQAIGEGSGSNAGACVSIYAPAVSIYAARTFLPGGNPTLAYDRANGTSFAAPLAAGVAARWMEQQRSWYGFTPGYQAVYEFLLNNASATVFNVTTPAYLLLSAHTVLV